MKFFQTKRTEKTAIKQGAHLNKDFGQTLLPIWEQLKFIQTANEHGSQNGEFYF